MAYSHSRISSKCPRSRTSFPWLRGPESPTERIPQPTNIKTRLHSLCRCVGLGQDARSSIDGKQSDLATASALRNQPFQPNPLQVPLVFFRSGIGSETRRDRKSTRLNSSHSQIS